MWPKAAPAVFEQRQRRIRDMEWGLVEPLLAPLAPGRFLDVGCGNGYFLWKAAQLGLQPEGVEPVPGLRAPLPGTEGPWPVHAGVAEALPFPDGHFQVVFACHALEHFQDRQLGLLEMRRVLAPGGLLVILVPTGTMALQNTLNHLVFGTHVRLAKRLLGHADLHWSRVFWPGAHGSACRFAAAETRDFAVERWITRVGAVFTLEQVRGTFLYPYPDFPQWLPVKECHRFCSSLLLVGRHPEYQSQCSPD